MKDKKCEMCYGFGFWSIGNLVPIGEMDSEEWAKRVVKCPWCGAGFAENERYKYLLDTKTKMEEKKK